MFKFILKYFTAKFAKSSQEGAKFFGALCVIFAVKNYRYFCPKTVITYLFSIL